MGETGVWKKITDAIMTTTLFTQLPTECVTGDTSCNIMYDTCPFAITYFTLTSKFEQHILEKIDVPVDNCVNRIQPEEILCIAL